jgi:hypothetical protein
VPAELSTWRAIEPWPQGMDREARRLYRLAGGEAVTRQTVLPTSSATSSAPWRSSATPTGRP